MKAKKLQLSLALTLGLLAMAGVLTLLGAIGSWPTAIYAEAPAAPLAAAPPSTDGPDAFGYVYTDSLTDPGLYHWVDIAASGTAITFGDTDESKTQVDLPQTMTFYGEDYTKIYVTTNGYATFQNTDVVSQCFPADRQPPDTLAAFCTDLNTGNTVYYSTTTAYNGHQTFIVQYDDVTHIVSGLTATF